jgi:hypothetical protein
VKVAEEKVVVDNSTACDLVTKVRIYVRVCRFLIGNLSDVKLIVQLAINDSQRGNYNLKR